MGIDVELANKVVNFLNELTEIDKVAIAALIANRVPCNEIMADHETVQVTGQHGGFAVGLLGILNGLCGIHENGYGPIAAEFEDGETLESYKNLNKFVVLKPEDIEV